MPFQSEKQRRFLWAAHPDIAKRWAHEYPESNKGLPMYAKKKKTQKEAALGALTSYVNKLNNLQLVETGPETGGVAKKANSKQEYIEIPHSEKPTYAGEERAQNTTSGQDFDMGNAGDNKPKKRENAINSLLQKISLVVGPELRRAKEKQDAALEGRPEQYVPDNLGNKRYPVATPGIMPPIGMQPQQAQAPQQAKQPQSRPSAPPVGNGSNAQARPIQSFGGLDVNNKLTGNSGLAGGRAPGANIKTSGSSPAWQRSEGKNEEGGLNAKGRASYNNATGGNLKAPVTESNPKGDRAKRQNSFCSRMCGMKRVNTGSKTKKDPDSRINKSLRKWNCKCSSVTELLETLRQQVPDTEKTSNLNLAARLGWQGVRKGFHAARDAFKGPMRTLGNNVPEGIFQAERQQALQTGNNFLKSFQPQGFQVYAGRVKTPQSIAGHGTQMTNDLLGFRLSSQGGYDQRAIDSLTKQLTDAGVQIEKSKMLTRPGYHGWNIAGKLDNTPVEFQLSPRRLQGLSAADHSMVYKPHESGVIPAIGKYVYKPALQYGMTVASPMMPAGKRLAYGAGGAAAVGGGGAAATYMRP